MSPGQCFSSTVSTCKLRAGPRLAHWRLFVGDHEPQQRCSDHSHLAELQHGRDNHWLILRYREVCWHRQCITGVHRSRRPDKEFRLPIWGAAGQNRSHCPRRWNPGRALSFLGRLQRLPKLRQQQGRSAPRISLSSIPRAYLKAACKDFLCVQASSPSTERVINYKALPQPVKYEELQREAFGARAYRRLWPSSCLDVGPLLTTLLQ